MDGAPDVKMDDQTGGDTGVDGDLTGQPEANLFANPRDSANQSFVPILLANKTNVTLNTLGGGDFVLLNHPNGVAGLNNLTIDGGNGQDTVALKHSPAGTNVTTVNVENTVTKSKDLFLQEVFELRLERPASDADLAFWSSALDRAGSLAVVQAIDNSPEAHAVQVRHLYQHYLGRAADANGLGYFVSLLNRGAHEEDVIASLLGSQEFLNKAETDFPGVSPNEAFVRELYQFALNRTATDSEVSFWVQQLPTNATAVDRSKVAVQFLFSREFRSDVIMALYSDLLRRQSDKGGISFFTAVGGDLRTLRETFLASGEFGVND